MIIETQCPQCATKTLIEVNEAEYFLWKNGMHIQLAFPDMPADIREQLISGICPKCWDKIFPPEEDEL